MQTQVINDSSCIRIINDGLPLIISKLQIKTIDTVRDELVRIDIGEGPLRHVFIKLSEVTEPAGLADVNALRDAIKAMLDGIWIGSGTGTGSGAAIDLTPLLTAVQAEGGKLDDVKAALNTLAQQLTASDAGKTQNLAAIKQSVDALGTAITNAGNSAELQIINDQIVSSGKDITGALQSLTQQLTGSGATQASFLAGTQQGIENLHTDIVNSGNVQAALLTQVLQMLTTIHTSQSMNNTFLYPTRIDDSDGNYIYNGFAISYTAQTADAVWAIQRITVDGHGLYVYEWANGNQQFNNVWDNRMTLAYAPLNAATAAV